MRPVVPPGILIPIGCGGLGLPGLVARIAVRAFPAPRARDTPGGGATVGPDDAVGAGVERTAGEPALEFFPDGRGFGEPDRDPLALFFPLGAFLPAAFLADTDTSLLLDVDVLPFFSFSASRSRSFSLSNCSSLSSSSFFAFSAFSFSAFSFSTRSFSSRSDSESEDSCKE